jgi:nitrite reductase/ring-hydroxylating ferredoxin subunit/uncharacterized membrane protein
MVRMRTSKTIEKLAARIEAADGLDAVAEKLNGLLGKIVKPGVVEDTLSGTPAGHPLHPALVSVPIGAWTTSLVLDLAGQDDAAGVASLLGTVSAIPAALTGASDWLTTSGPERRVGLVHAASNYAGIVMQIGSLLARRRGHRGSAIALSVAGFSATGLGGWLGGHLSYALGVGVDTTAFQKYSADWVDVASESDVPETGALGATAAGVPVLVARVDGSLVALADRCTHRGAPLHEGDVKDGCIHCPWHDSVFDLTDGSVVSGPATRPQPTFEVEVTDGRVRVRRNEERALRSNLVGH